MEIQLRRLAVFILIFMGTLWFNSRVSWAEDEAKSCLECHERETNSFQSEHHKRAWGLKKDTAEESCKTCHGDSKRHVETKGEVPLLLLSFVKDIQEKSKELNEKCLNCHIKSTHMTFWDAGKHSRNGVTCSTCHTLHGGQASVKPTPQKCMGCHTEIKILASQRSHHPIKEGKVTCNDCHNPHGTINKYNLREGAINQTCYKCHPEKRGPYMWEHPPVEEDCTICHNPHGSRNVKLLVEKVPILCENCHDWSGHPGTQYDNTTGFGRANFSNRSVARSCNNCHVRIHGSNSPANPASGYNSGQFFVR